MSAKSISAEQEARQTRKQQAKALKKPWIRLAIRGRSITLRGLKRPPSGVLMLLAILGPGLISANAGVDAGFIATFSSVGAQYGYGLLWLLIPMALALSIVQETAGRLGVATGRGLLDLIRERFGIGWAFFAIVVVLMTNTITTISELVGTGAAFELFGVPRIISVPLTAVAIWWLMAGGSYNKVEKIFLTMTLVFFAYPISAILSHPNWGEVAHNLVIPSVQPSAAYVSIVVAIIGTMLTPYQQIFQESAVVERGIPRREYGHEAIDIYIGSIFASIIAMFIIIATAATLHQQGKTDINSAADAAHALEPIAGPLAKIIFGVGLIGSSFLAAAVLPLATAYATAEAFGFRKGIDLGIRRAPIFFGIFTGIIILAALVALIPGLPVIPLIVGIQMLNGLLLPIILIFMLLLANNKRLMGNMKNGRIRNIVSVLVTGIITITTLFMLADTILSAFGIHMLG